MQASRTAPAPVWLVAGPPGAGKSTVASLLLARLDPVPALVDKDTVYGGFVAELLTQAGRPYGEREGSWYDTHVKQHEYGGMAATAAEIRSYGCPVLLCAPFTGQVHHAQRWRDYVRALGGGPAHLVWLRCDPATLRARLVARGLDRDSEKLAHFAAFLAGVRPDEPPVVPYHEVDNRVGAAESLADQVAGIVAAVAGGGG